MKTTITFISLSLVIVSFTFQSDFLTEQKKFERVRIAVNEKEQLLIQKLKSNNLSLSELNIIIVIYKDNDELEIHAKSKSQNTYSVIASYPICSRSGQLGPKRKQSDNQVPEGFYYIDKYNPTSSYYLSLQLSYPNQADRKKSKAKDLGGDIFIHGSCVTIGCIPMTDDKIKEIYLYAINAKNNRQTKIPVYVFPFKMTDQNFLNYKTKYKDNIELIDFWANLKTGYHKFINEKKEIPFTINSNGDYTY